MSNVLAQLTGIARAHVVCAGLLAGLAAGMVQAGQSVSAGALRFDGSAVSGCSLSGSTYTCASFPLTGGSDSMTIASGYTVNVQASSTFTFNQSLVMSGTARLNVTGNLDIGSIATSNLQVSGGTLTATGSFTAGSQAQTLTANIAAASMTLGSGSALTITGNLTSTGAVSFASHVTLNGSVSAATISTGSPTTINGNVTASTAFTLASGSTVTGNIVAPTVTLKPTGSTVTGSITASTSLTVGSSDTINGNVTAGTLTLQSSNAIIYGSATVASADLGWQGRVTNTIYCTGGTTAGHCDCVINNSGYAIGSAQGPTCSSQQSSAPAGLDHLLITHDGSASACTPEPVTVKACADAACSTVYTGGVTGTLSPGGASFTIGSSGTTTTQPTVTQNSVGTVALAVTGSTPSASNALACNNTGTTTTGCNMQFDGNVGISLTAANQYAGASTSMTLQSKVYDASTNQCGPGFASVTKTVTVSCTYDNPATGSTALQITGNGASQTVTCNSSSSTINLAFNANGYVNPTPYPNPDTNLVMKYPDVGAITVKMSIANGAQTATATRQVIVAPAALAFPSAASPNPPNPPTSVTAGSAAYVIVKALTVDGTATQNFGRETAREGVTLGAAAPYPCPPAATTPGDLPTTQVTNAGGVLSLTAAYPEAGWFNWAARLSSVADFTNATDASHGGYLGSGLAPTIALSGSGCGSALSYPAYFAVKAGAAYYYSGQPIDATVTAMNAAGQITLKYDRAMGTSNDVQLSVVDPAGTGTVGAAPAGLIDKSAFSHGVATLPTTGARSLAYTFKNFPTVPTTVTLRAAETVTSNAVSSANGASYQSSQTPPPAQPAEAQPQIRSGRMRLGGAFGSSKGDLDLPVVVEYYASNGWRRNVSDAFTIHAAAVGIAPMTTALNAPANKTGDIVIANGQGKLTLHPTGGIGTAIVMINLGNSSADLPAQACRPSPLPTTAGGAVLAWLRAPNGICGSGAAGDPVARATFGTASLETKRLVHVREVFN
jgi:MSHA biogenesis protein MshQ